MLLLIIYDFEMLSFIWASDFYWVKFSATIGLSANHFGIIATWEHSGSRGTMFANQEYSQQLEVIFDVLWLQK